MKTLRTSLLTLGMVAGLGVFAMNDVSSPVTSHRAALTEIARIDKLASIEKLAVEIEVLRKNHARMRRLLPVQAVSQAEFEKSETTLRVTQLEHQAQLLELERTETEREVARVDPLNTTVLTELYQELWEKNAKIAEVRFSQASIQEQFVRSEFLRIQRLRAKDSRYVSAVTFEKHESDLSKAKIEKDKAAKVLAVSKRLQQG